MGLMKRREPIDVDKDRRPDDHTQRSPGRQPCKDAQSKELPHDEDTPPADRGACEKESQVQGSE